MIPLAAVETALEAGWSTPGQGEGPCLAVECTPDEEHPELVLFTTLEIDRETANRCLRDAGLSPLHNIRRVLRLETLPLLALERPTTARSRRCWIAGGASWQPKERRRREAALG